MEIEEKNATTAAIKSQMILSDTKVVAAWDGVIESGSTVRWLNEIYIAST